MLIVTDPGHSGPIEPGACGPAGTREADVVLAVSKLIRQCCQEKYGHDVILTREEDTDDDNLSWRGRIANENNADLFISIHCNAATSREAEGFEVWTTPGTTYSDYAADCIFDAIALEFPEYSAREDLSDGDHDKEAKFTVLVVPDCPAVLIELLFISNPKEEQDLINPDIQLRYACAIAKGIHNYFMTHQNY